MTAVLIAIFSIEILLIIGWVFNDFRKEDIRVRSREVKDDG